MSENSYDKKYYLTHNGERYVKVSYAQSNIEDLQAQLSRANDRLAKITDMVSDVSELSEIDVLRIYRLSANKVMKLREEYEQTPNFVNQSLTEISTLERRLANGTEIMAELMEVSNLATGHRWVGFGVELEDRIKEFLSNTQPEDS